MPWSEIATTVCSAELSIATSIAPPLGEYSTALERILLKAWNKSLASPTIMTGVPAKRSTICRPGTMSRCNWQTSFTKATVVFRNNAIELMRSQQTLARQAALLEEQLAHEQRLALLQRNFVSMASHEFRTPMTVIDGHARQLDG